MVEVKTKAKDFLKSAWPYAGLPVLAIALLILRAGRADPFILLRAELILAFGYIAAIQDLKTRRIPNVLVLATIAAWALIMTPSLYLDTGAAIRLLGDSALGAAVSGGMFLLVYLMSRKGLGGGDVKLMAAVGLYLGLGGALSAMLLGTILAALAGLTLILLKKIGRKDAIPLAPFLYIGIAATIFLS